jgi:parallel beta-helix repeat protein
MREEVPGEGEEFDGGTCNNPRGICLYKGDTVASVAGAEATVIDACAVSFAAVILANNSRFGLPHRGFTLINATSASVAVALAANVAISGNISRVADRASSGFQIESGENIRVTGNLARDGNYGFYVSVDVKDVKFTDNVSVSNEFGFQTSSAHPVLLRRNVAIGNDIGFVLFGGSHILRRNSVIGNRDYGIYVGGPEAPLITHNNIFGNNNVPREGDINCGILNVGNPNIDATNNFWGAPTGPGANPADEACNRGPGQIIHTPFAKKEFPLRHRAALTLSSPEGAEEGVQ